MNHNQKMTPSFLLCLILKTNIQARVTEPLSPVSFSAVMMSALAQVRLRSSYQQMTPLPTPCWTPVREARSRRSSLTTAASILLLTVERRQPAPPGSPPPTAHWDCKSINKSQPSPSRRRQRRLMSQCWPSRDNPSHSCHVTFINTNRREGMKAARSNRGQTRSCRTTNLFLSPALSAVPG